MKTLTKRDVAIGQVLRYGKLISAILNEFIESQDFYANLTVYNIRRYTPLMMIKLTFDEKRKDITISKHFVDTELNKLKQCFREKEFVTLNRKKELNYRTEVDVYMIRPNQRRFWTQSMALKDAISFIIQMLNGSLDNDD